MRSHQLTWKDQRLDRLEHLHSNLPTGDHPFESFVIIKRIEARQSSGSRSIWRQEKIECDKRYGS